MSLSSQSSTRENFSQEMDLFLEDDDDEENKSTDSESENVPSNGQISNQDFRSSRNEFRPSSQESRDSRIGFRVSGQVRGIKEASSSSSKSGPLLNSMESSRFLTER